MIDMSSDQTFQQFCDEFDAVITSLRRKITAASSSTQDALGKKALIQEVFVT